MTARVLADCTQSGNCPRITQLDDGTIAITGQWTRPGLETTVTIPADLFTEAAKAWLDDTGARLDYRTIRREQHPRSVRDFRGVTGGPS